MSQGKKTLTEEELKRAWSMRSAGALWREIGDAFGMSRHIIRRAMDPEFAEMEKARRKNRVHPPRERPPEPPKISDTERSIVRTMVSRTTGYSVQVSLPRVSILEGVQW